MQELSIAVVGATGAVGTEFFRILEQRYPVLPRIKALASGRSAGKRLSVGGRELTVEETSEDSFAGVDVAFISVSSEVSRRFAPAAGAAGAVGPSTTARLFVCARTFPWWSRRSTAPM